MEETNPIDLSAIISMTYGHFRPHFREIWMRSFASYQRIRVIAEEANGEQTQLTQLRPEALSATGTDDPLTPGEIVACGQQVAG